MSEYKSNCIICGNEFISNSSLARTCSGECKKQRQKDCKADREERISGQQKLERVCAHCGKIFYYEGRRNLDMVKFCSEKCRYNHKNKERWAAVRPPDPEPRDCIICGKTFVPARTHPGAATCSLECNIERQHARSRDKTQNKEPCIVTCKICNKEFSTKKHNKMYCSKECLAEASRARGRMYNANKDSEAKKHEKYVRRMGGNYKRALERDGHRCQICMSDENINVHHIDGNGEKKNGKRQKDNTSLDNLITLCGLCHKQMHGVLLSRTNSGEWVISRAKCLTSLAYLGISE